MGSDKNFNSLPCNTFLSILNIPTESEKYCRILLLNNCLV